MLMVRDCPADLDNEFGPQVNTCLRAFDFTLTFEESILTILPTGLFLVAAVPRLIFLLRRPRLTQRKGLRTTKLVVSVLLTLLYLALLIFWVTGSTPVTHITDTAAALCLLAGTFVCALSDLEHVRSVRPSASLEIYLFSTVLLDLARTRTLWLINDGSVITVLFTASLGVKLILLALEIKGKQALLKANVRDCAPEETSGLISRSLFTWLIKLLNTGYRQVLSSEDMYPLDQKMGSEPISIRFHNKWASSLHTSNHTLVHVLFSVFRSDVFAPVLPRIFLIGLTFSQPLLINRVIKYLNEPEAPDIKNVGYGLIGAYALVYTGIAVSTAYYWYRVIRVTTMVRAALVASIYAKTTDVDITTLDDSAAVTLMGTDVERITNGMRNIHELWANTVEIAMGIYLLQLQVGLACLVSLVVALISAMIGIWLGASVGERQKGWMDALQKRIGATSEALGSIKGVKMTGMTQVLEDLLQGLRVNEIESASRFRALQIIMLTLASVPLTITPLLTFAFATMIAKDHNTILDVSRLFTALSVLTLLATKFTNLFQSIPALMGAFACFKRIQTFLLDERRNDSRNSPSMLGVGVKLPESILSGIDSSLDNPFDIVMQKLDPSTFTKQGKPLNSVFDALWDVRLDNASFRWFEQEEPALHNITTDIRQLNLTMIVGPIASGKSTLLKGILGEVDVVGGGVEIRHKEVAFCDQTPWIMHGTIKQNILGFSQFEKDRYGDVVHSCALGTDIALFPQGDQTMIGSKGITLSGGQRQRIAVARAVYAAKRIAIFDDVLSGLDATTSQHVFDHVFGWRGLLRRQGTTVILATHAVHLIPQADHVIALNEEGRIVEQGQFHELKTSGGYIESLSVQQNQSDVRQNVALPSPISKFSSSATLTAELKTRLELSKEDSKHSKDRRMRDVRVYGYYFAAAGLMNTALFFVAEIAFTTLEYFPSIWLKWWVESNSSHPNQRVGYYLGIYAAFQLLCLAALYFGARHVATTMVVKSGKTLHSRLLKTVLAAPMSYFDKTDTGTTLNKFSQDLQLIDAELPIALLMLGVSGFGAVAQAVLVFVASYWIGFAFIAVLGIFYLVQKHYLRTSRQLRLLELEAKSPLYSLFIESLDGLATIRAFGWQEHLKSVNLELLDASQKPLYLLYCIQRWLTLVLGLICAGLATVLITLVVLLRDSIGPGSAAVALVNMISFSSSLMSVVMVWAQLETSMGAVSRVRKLQIETLSEEPLGEEVPPPDYWPNKGEIRFNDLTARYSLGSAPVLKNIDLIIQPGEKIAICGRSGSGKSSMILSLFRMMEISNGYITIDGLDHAFIPRQYTRSRLNALPQEPYFLAGNIRTNADPMCMAEDRQIIEALRKVELWDMLEARGGLDLETDLSFLSHGQHQLFCLARAILRQSSIVVLDEVTSSVDQKTEALMQRLIFHEFRNRTVIMIAHRLELALNCNRIVLLEHGSILECGKPAALLSYPSEFSKLFDTYAASKNFDARLVARRLNRVPSSSRRSAISIQGYHILPCQCLGDSFAPCQCQGGSVNIQ